MAIEAGKDVMSAVKKAGQFGALMTAWQTGGLGPLFMMALEQGISWVLGKIADQFKGVWSVIQHKVEDFLLACVVVAEYTMRVDFIKAIRLKNHCQFKNPIDGTTCMMKGHNAQNCPLKHCTGAIARDLCVVISQATKHQAESVIDAFMNKVL